MEEQTDIQHEKKIQLINKLTQRDYNREYYQKVRKIKTKQRKCRDYNIEYRDYKEIKIIIEPGPHILQY